MITKELIKEVFWMLSMVCLLVVLGCWIAYAFFDFDFNRTIFTLVYFGILGQFASTWYWGIRGKE